MGPKPGDVVLAVGAAGLSACLTAVSDGFQPADRPVDALAVALAAAAGLALLPRRVAPRATLAAVTAFSAAYLLLDYPYGPVLLAYAVAVHTAARRLPLARSAPVALVSLAVLLTHLLLERPSAPGLFGLVPGSAWAVVPFALGTTARARGEAAERGRAEEIREHAHAERLRVAQEVHDVVGHGLAAIKMQADVALHLLDTVPGQARTALEAISRTSAEALTEVRAALALVHRAEDPGRGGLGRLGELRARMALAGMRVEVATVGPVRELPAAVDLACHRVVQESLTNALRHGEGHAAEVGVEYLPEAVVLTVRNPTGRAGGAAGEAVGGLGIPGMRRRVAALGGEFTAGPEAGGGFTVRAVLPTGGRR